MVMVTMTGMTVNIDCWFWAPLSVPLYPFYLCGVLYRKLMKRPTSFHRI